MPSPPVVSAIDLFCGAGGLSFGLASSGVAVQAGIDVDGACRHAFEANVGAHFIEQDVRKVSASLLEERWIDGAVRVLAGCAPCQPFSPYRRGVDTSAEEQWPLLDEFGRLVAETLPEIVTMENVPRIAGAAVFKRFVAQLEKLDYDVDYRVCRCEEFGLPQRRRRLVLLASRLAPITVPTGTAEHVRTVRESIADLPKLDAGEQDPNDPLHKARVLTPINLRRIKASSPGGTWEEWPEELRAPCHRKASGSSFRNVYGRMQWDDPSPTITTLSFNFGTGRFGHPEQDRSITLREAAVLQGFPLDYEFFPENETASFSRHGRLIGNAVPPPLGAAVGSAILEHVAEHGPSVEESSA